MSYGLYDADLKYYPVPFYNLELMKLSTYYKKKREIVGLSPTFSPNLYKNFIVRQDFYSPNIFPPPTKNIIYGGRAFDGEKYKPLSEDIEVMKPDKELYFKIKFSKRANQSTISTMRRAEHLRLSLDGKTIWRDFEKQLWYNSDTFGIIFHDYNLEQIDGAFDFIKENISSIIKHKQGARVGMKFPVLVERPDNMYKWLQLDSLNEYFSLQYENIIDNSMIGPLCEIAQISNSWRRSSVNITKNYDESYFINGGFQRLYRNIVNLRSHKLCFPLIYDESTFTNNDWKRVLKLIDSYNKHVINCNFSKKYEGMEPYETLISYLRNAYDRVVLKKPFRVDDAREILQFVRENDYNLFKDFYEYRGEEVR